MEECHEEERIFIHNLIMQGPERVGKSHLVHTFARNGASPYNVYLPTIGTDYAARDIHLDDKLVAFHICDLSGHPNFLLCNDMSRVFPHAVAAMLVYDVTDRASFEKMLSLIDTMDQRGTGPKQIPVLLVGNKADLREQREVDYEMGKKFADFQGLPFIETSALTGENVEFAFITIASIYLRSKSSTVN